MTTITQLTETLNTTIDESNVDIEKLDHCNECMANRIVDNRHQISWNEGVIAHAELMLEEIEKGQMTAICEVATTDLKEFLSRTLSGKELDRCGDIIGCERKANESDDAYRKRMYVMQNVDHGEMNDAICGAHDKDLRVRLAAALHDHTRHWMKIAINRPDIGRDFLDKSFDELNVVDRFAPLRDADRILDVVRGE